MLRAVSTLFISELTQILGYRITVERSLGMLVRTWQILYHGLQYNLENSRLIIMVCAKLHNFIKTLQLQSNELRDEHNGTTIQDYQIFNNRDAVHQGDCNVFDDDDVLNEMNNYYMDQKTRRVQNSDKREWLVNLLYDNGIRFNLRRESDYVFE